MTNTWVRHTSGDHVRVANRLDFLKSILLGQPIKLRENAIEISHDIAGRRPADPRRKFNDVRKQDRHFIEVIGNDLA
jgi:hypothetical protein